MKRSCLSVGVLLALACAAARSACGHADFLHDIAVMESSLDPTERNPYGYVGLYQMGEAALQDAGYYRGDRTRTNDWTGSWTGASGINNLADFFANPDAQVEAVVGYHNRVLAQIRQFGLERSIGTTIAGVPVTLSGLVAGAHLVGVGNLLQFVNSAGATVPRDGNGVPVTSYIAALGGCTVGSTAPAFATVAAAAGSAGVGPVPVLPPSAGVPAPPPPVAVGPSTAFALASGQQLSALRDAIAAIVATLLTLWLVWTSQSGFFAWCKRRMSLFALKADIVRGCIVLCVVLVVLQ